MGLPFETLAAMPAVKAPPMPPLYSRADIQSRGHANNTNPVTSGLSQRTEVYNVIVQRHNLKDCQQAE